VSPGALEIARLKRQYSASVVLKESVQRGGERIVVFREWPGQFDVPVWVRASKPPSASHFLVAWAWID
jgi:hypothetical protein